MTSFYFHLGAVLVLLFTMFRPVQGAFGRRGSSEIAKVLPSKTAPSAWGGGWSSTGMQGLDHTDKYNDVDMDMDKVLSVASRKIPRIHPDIDYTQDTLLEHHPYASGSFTLHPLPTEFSL
jgi:hypothetical protein